MTTQTLHISQPMQEQRRTAEPPWENTTEYVCVSGAGVGMGRLGLNKFYPRYITKTSLYNFDPLKSHFYIYRGIDYFSYFAKKKT